MKKKKKKKKENNIWYSRFFSRVYKKFRYRLKLCSKYYFIKKKFNFFYIFLNFFHILISKLFLKNKKNYFNIFHNKNYFKKHFYLCKQLRHAKFDEEFLRACLESQVPAMH